MKTSRTLTSDAIRTPSSLSYAGKQAPVTSTFRLIVCVACGLLAPSLAIAQTGNTTHGTNAGSSLTSGDNNTLIGDTAGAAMTSSSNCTVVGHNAGALTKNWDNTFIGQSAGAANILGTDNTFVGARAGLVNTGKDGTFIGSEAGASNTTGEKNTFIGERAGYSNIDGDNNVFVGQGAGLYSSTATDNTFVGAGAGAGDPTNGLTGSYNLAVGGGTFTSDTVLNGVTFRHGIGATGEDLSTGFANAFVGAGAGGDNGAGVGNTSIGCNAGAHSEHADFNTFVGAQAGWDNNRTNDTTKGNRNTYLGFGAGQSNMEGEDNVGAGAFSDYDTVMRSRCTFFGAETKPHNDDTIVIGYQAQATGSNSIAIGNTVTVSADNEVVIGNSAVVSIGGPVTWTATSDGRLKTDVVENVPGLDFIDGLRPVSYQIDAAAAHTFGGAELPAFLRQACAEKSKVRYTGFIAQEVQRAAEAAGFDFSGVKIPDDPSSQTYGLRYAEFVVPLAKAVQELSVMSEVRDARIAAQTPTAKVQAMHVRHHAAVQQRLEAMMAEMSECIEQLEAR